MKVISLISQKGGAGKTTITVNLAVMANLSKKSSIVLDIDPQASATCWKDSRENEDPTVISCQATRLENTLDVAKENGVDFVFIDTAPHSEGSALKAAKLSDLVIIPCRPAILDLRAINSTIDIANIAKTPASIVLNAVPARGSLKDEALQAAEQYGVEVAPVQLGNRVAYVHSITEGLSVNEYEKKGKSAEEIKNLYKYICKKVK